MDYIIYNSIQTCVCARKNVIVASFILSLATLHLFVQLYVSKGRFWMHRSMMILWVHLSMALHNGWVLSAHTSFEIQISILISTDLFVNVMTIAFTPFGGTIRRAHGNCCKFFPITWTPFWYFVTSFLYHWHATNTCRCKSFWEHNLTWNFHFCCLQRVTKGKKSMKLDLTPFRD